MINFVKTDRTLPLLEGGAFAIGGDANGDGQPEATGRNVTLRSPRAWGFQVEAELGDVQLELSAEDALAVVLRVAQAIPGVFKRMLPE